MADEAKAGEIILRPPGPGDLSWLQYRHMRTMAPAYGWGVGYEAHLAEIVAHFLKHADDPDVRFWVAERDSEVLGCIGLTRESAARGRLRLLYVEPQARGLGLGRRLAETCVETARAASYAEVILWTVDVLTAARAVYAALGFEVIAAAPSELGPSMTDETWLLRF